MLGENEGALEGIGAGKVTLKGNLSGAPITVEQQLQIQKGVQVSSPQSLECCLWSEMC